MPFIRTIFRGPRSDLPHAGKPRGDVAPLANRTHGMVDNLGMTSVGLEMGISVIIGMFFGRWLDGQAGTQPWLMILFVMFGFAAGLRGVLREVNKADRRAAASDAAAAAANPVATTKGPDEHQ